MTLGASIIRIALVVAIIASSAPAGEREAKVDSAIASGLAYLAKQQADDGSFTSEGPRVTMTGLALMSLLSAGHVQDVGRYGLTVRRAADYLVNACPNDGYYGPVDGSRMYGHAVATLALAEAYGVEPDPQQRARIREVVKRAVAVILKAQDVEKPESHAGGWRYEPQSTDSDLSATAWNVLALRAARGIGIKVPQASFDRAAAYVMKCYRAEEGGFAYQAQGEVGSGMTGVGVLLLSLLDGAQLPRLPDVAATMAARAVDDRTRYPYYAIHYVTQAAVQVGDPIQNMVWAGNSDWLVKSQTPDGGWPASRNGEEPGRVYSTAMAVLTLTAPGKVLPVYQKQ